MIMKTTFREFNKKLNATGNVDKVFVQDIGSIFWFS